MLGDALIDAVPQLRDMANISVEQIAQVSSPDISIDNWLRLARRINSALVEDHVQGMVITHGTDHWKKQHTSSISSPKAKSRSLW